MAIKFQVMSDLHLEFNPGNGRGVIDAIRPAADVLVLAGDVLSLRHPAQAERSLRDICDKFESVVYVPGNHEFYGLTPAEGESVLGYLGQMIPNFHVLAYGRPVTIRDTRFVGDTLWFRDDHMNAFFSRHLSDFTQIKGFVPWVYGRNLSAIAALRADTREGDVVVTHHLPSPKSTPSQFVDSPINRFFVCDMEDVIHRTRPAVWVHGHTHDACDYKLADTRVVCNPLGYPREGVTGFNPELVIEV